jgi:hypothetical protein
VGKRDVDKVGQIAWARSEAERLNAIAKEWDEWENRPVTETPRLRGPHTGKVKRLSYRDASYGCG